LWRFGEKLRLTLLQREAYIFFGWACLGGTMKIEIEKVVRAQYDTPVLTVQGSFESLTQQDVDGRRFDASFNAGDPIPPAFAS
jgi:hypothetical protein